MPAINITAAELQVGDVLLTGATVIEVEEYTIPGYELKQVRVVDDRLRPPCVAFHIGPNTQLTVQRAS